VDERARIAEHVRACPSCAADLDTLRRADGASRRARRRWFFPAAASLLLIVAAGWQLVARQGGPAPASDPSPVVLVLPPAQRSGGGVPAVPAGRALLVEALLPLHADDAAYRVRIRRADATAKVELDRIVVRAPGEEIVRLPVPGGLRPGHHELAFAESEGDHEVDVRGFDVQAPP
jgi:hypothetical protein